MLEVRNLHAKIGDKEILKGINLTIKDGETHAIMGPNGSGKSTVCSVVAGLLDAENGRVVLGGRVLDGPGRFVAPESVCGRAVRSGACQA